MTVRRRIAVLTSNRADFGLLAWPMKMIAESPAFDLSVVATGAHLLPDFGMTIDEVEADFPSTLRVPVVHDADDGAGAARTFGDTATQITGALQSVRPDLVMILGDRYETLAAGMAAFLMRIPLAHLCGGDVTTGAFDDSVRHALTKLSHLHFATSVDAAQRIRQLGERPDRIFAVGNPAIDGIVRQRLCSRDEFFSIIGFKPRTRNLLVTFHPVTVYDRSIEQLQELLAALGRFGDEIGILFTGSNSDPGGREFGREIQEFVALRPNALLVKSLGNQLYYSAIAHCDAVVGNSSSGLYEVPTFKRPTVNIGDRQNGRLRAASVLDCPPDADRIVETILRSFDHDCSQVANPYGDGKTSERILAVLEGLPDFPQLLEKTFQTIQ